MMMTSRNLLILYKRKFDQEVAVASSEIGVEVEKIKGGIKSFNIFSWYVYVMNLFLNYVLVMEYFVISISSITIL